MLLHTDYLSVSAAHAGAVYIPLAELPQRTHELPPPQKEILLIRDSADAHYALGWLHARGRRARLAEPPTHAEPEARYRLWQPNEWLEELLFHPMPEIPRSARNDKDSLGEEGLSFRAERGISQPAAALSFRAERGISQPAAALSFRAERGISNYLIEPSTALDLGCGSGREAVYLADWGWQVTAVDRLPEALARGRDLQARYAPHSPPIHWLCIDLEKSDWQPEDKFDLIMLFYFYARELIQRACAWLNPSGALLVEAFTERHRARYGKPASDMRIARANELPSLLPSDMRIIHYSEDWRTNGRHTARLWAISTLGVERRGYPNP